MVYPLYILQFLVLLHLFHLVVQKYFLIYLLLSQFVFLLDVGYILLYHLAFCNQHHYIHILVFLIGYCCFFKREEKEIGENDKPGLAQISRKQWGISVCVVLLLLALLLFAGQQTESPILWQIASTFSGISLTLFGGGYVVIPALHELFVDNLGWLTSPEFADGIAIGQVTPGPIFITATFIGYLVAGFWGALIATVSIFTPPAVLTVLLSRFIEVIRDSKVVKAMLQGIRAAVIGMIFASAITIGNTMPLEVRTIALFLINFGISYKYNLNPIFLILGSGLIGLILFAI